MSSRGHVEIVGGGMAGLAAATAFRRIGWTARVHERMQELRVVGSGLAVFANTLRVLNVLGAEEEATLGAWSGNEFHTRNRYGVTTSFRRRSGLRSFEVTRQQLLNALYRAAERAGVEIVTNSPAVHIDPEGAIRLENGRTLKADLVIAADGVHSRLRDQLGIPYRRRPLRDGAIRTMTPRLPEEVNGPEAFTSREYWSGHRRILAVPCNDTDLYVALTTLDTDEAGKRVPLDKALWKKAFPGAADLVERLNGEARWDRFVSIKMSRWSKGRAVVLGDAAHAMTPNLGQGGACGMMNGLSLATYLSDAQDIPAALLEWETRERHLTDHTQLVSGLYSGLATWPDAPRAFTFWTVAQSTWLARQTYRLQMHVPTGTEDLPPPIRSEAA